MKRRAVVMVVCLVLGATAVAAVLITSRRFDGATGDAAPASSTPTPVTMLPKSDEAGKNFGWRQIDGDDFDGGKLDTSNWTVYDGFNAASNTTWSPKQCDVRDGLLILTGAHDTAGTTCGISWQRNQTYGRWEVRARFPAPAASAYDPVFLLWPADDANWTSTGEIDFAEEYDPNRQYIESWLHGPGNTQAGYERKDIDLTRWHNFAVDWQPGHITCYIDGVPWVGYADPGSIPSKPMHLVLQQNFVPHTPADVPPIRSGVEIDWVRIYGR